jgi:2-polyprenyl-3-methyl-5-hydroxy-6-metoxy-1,4-benzoquinol methylase
MIWVSADIEPALEDVACPTGCTRSDELLLVARDRLHDLPGAFSIVRCRRCGLMRTNPRPTPEAMGAYYPAEYGPYQGTRVEPDRPTRRRLPGWFRSIARRLLDTRAQSLPPVAAGHLLEIGCASGSFMHLMARSGWRVTGIEFSATAATAARSLGYEVHAGSLESAPPPTESYDLVVGWMVLEHLHDPVACLRKLHEWTRPGGWLAISVPNAGSLEFRIFGNRWYALQVPTHLCHFTPDTLTSLLQQGGWQVEKVLHQRVLSNLFASVGYCLVDAGFERVGRWFITIPERAGRLEYLVLPVAWLLASLGQTGRMTVWARREPS